MPAASSGLAQQLRHRILVVVAAAFALGFALATAGTASADTCNSCPGGGGTGGGTTDTPPTASFTSTPSSPTPGVPVSFDGSASKDPDGGTITGYSWAFGDGATDTTSGAQPSHAYSSPGTYTVTLTVSESDGVKTDSVSHTVTVDAGTVSLTGTFGWGGHVDGGTLSFVAASGVANNVTGAKTDGGQSCGFLGCYYTAGTVTLSDGAGPLAAGNGCSQAADGKSVTCQADDPALVSVSTGDGDDHVDLSGLGAWSTSIDPGAGNNTVIGGPGENTIDYSSRVSAVSVDLVAGTASNGLGGQDALTKIQDIRGGSGNDQLTGDSQDNVIDGGPGTDKITGGGGSDTVDYSRRTNAVFVTLSGGSGTGGETGETDALSGISSVRGGAGADRITTNDAMANRVSCGGGTDHVVADKLDTIDSDCEEVEPFEQSAPVISGTPRDGDTLTASHGNWGGSPAPTFAYQWRACAADGTGCADVTGATASTYTPGHSDVGHTFYVHVTATSSSGTASADSDKTLPVAPAPPVNAALPTVSGTAQVGQVLTASPGSWGGTPATYAYQWRRCDADGNGCADIIGATATTYTPGLDDIGHRLRMHVTATNTAAVSGVSANSDPTATVQPGPASGGGSAAGRTGSSGGTPSSGGGSSNGAPAKRSARCIVPKLKGKTLKQARKMLAAAHCSLGKATTKHRGRHGRVLSQTPGPGSRRGASALVSLVVGK